LSPKRQVKSINQVSLVDCSRDVRRRPASTSSPGRSVSTAPTGKSPRQALRAGSSLDAAPACAGSVSDSLSVHLTALEACGTTLRWPWLSG
jgi:hypothetical protein